MDFLENVTDLATRLASTKTDDHRRIIALAGPPAAGKSEAAAALQNALISLGHSAAILPMDGFHFDDAILTARGLLPYKGAPDTFDVPGFNHTLDRLIRNTEPEIAVPVFDRALEISRAGARMIPQDITYLIVEGNYLLLKSQPWSDLAPRFDTTVLVTSDEPTLRKRLTQRWESAGLPDAEVTRKVTANDLPNCRLVLAQSNPADFVIKT